jgi:hypothetical protein
LYNKVLDYKGWWDETVARLCIFGILANKLLASFMDLLNINAMIIAARCGAVSHEDLITWADKLIVKFDEPDCRLFDVSTSKDIHEAIAVLKSFGEHDDLSLVSGRAFTIFLEGLKCNKTSYERVAQEVYSMAFSGLIPNPEIEGEMITYWDELDIANDGIYGNPEEIKNEMHRMLEKHGS